MCKSEVPICIGHPVTGRARPPPPQPDIGHGAVPSVMRPARAGRLSGCPAGCRQRPPDSAGAGPGCQSPESQLHRGPRWTERSASLLPERVQKDRLGIRMILFRTWKALCCDILRTEQVCYNVSMHNVQCYDAE